MKYLVGMQRHILYVQVQKYSIAVSYTHLDVYKRQDRDRESNKYPL